MIDVHYRYQTLEHEQLLSQNYHANEKCSYSVYNNIYVIPETEKGKTGGLYDENGCLVGETSLNKDCDVEFVDLKSREEFEELSFPCIYLGVYENTWGHFITDCLKKIWILVEKTELKLTEYKLIFVSNKACALGNNQRRLLELLGIDTSNIVLITKDTLTHHVIVPDSCFFYSKESWGIPYSTFIQYTDEYVDLIHKLKERYNGKEDGKYEKIYYSYSKYQKNKGYKKHSERKSWIDSFRIKAIKSFTPKTIRWMSSCKCLRAVSFLHQQRALLVIILFSLMRVVK